MSISFSSYTKFSFIPGFPHEKQTGSSNVDKAREAEENEEMQDVETQLGVGMPSTNGSSATAITNWVQSFKQDFMHVSENGQSCFKDSLTREVVKAVWDRISHWITRKDIASAQKKIKQLQIEMRMAFRKMKT